MGFFDKLAKSKFPDSNELVRIPTRLKESHDNLQINKIMVRFFNQDFSKVIESEGIISHKTSIPIIYFDKPDKLACIMFDDTSYIDVTRNNLVCIDICESYPYGLPKDSSLQRDLKAKYYNDLVDNKLGEKAKKLYEESGCGYYIPVLLNNIPIPIIEKKSSLRLSMINTEYIEHVTTITANIIRQLSDVKLLERVGKKDNSALMFCALLFFLLGGFVSFILVLYLV